MDEEHDEGHEGGDYEVEDEGDAGDLVPGLGEVGLAAVVVGEEVGEEAGHFTEISRIE